MLVARMERAHAIFASTRGAQRTKRARVHPSLSALTLLVTVAAIAACAPRPSPQPPPARSSCTNLEACEAALLAAAPADVPARLNELAGVQESDGLARLYAALVSDAGCIAIVAFDERITATAPSPCDDGFRTLLVPSSARPKHVSPERALLAIARSAGHAQLFALDAVATATVSHDAEHATQLFATDVLAPTMFGTTPRLRVPRARIKEAASLGRAIDTAFAHAGSFDYVAAARDVDALRLRRAAFGPDTEPGARLAHALALFMTSGIALEERAPTDAANKTKPQGGSSAYADLLFARTATTERSAEYQERRARIVAEVHATRAHHLDARLGEPLRCGRSSAPAIDEAADLELLYELAASLDSKSPSESSSATQLGIEPWLARYRRAVELVRATKTSWLFAEELLTQRGTAANLGLEQSAIYGNVNELALAHLGALEELAVSEPSRVRVVALGGLAYLPGIAEAPPLRSAVTRLLSRAVAGKVQAAATVSQVYDAGVGALALAISHPGYLQSSELAALRDALGTSLTGPMAREPGWGLAGLHAGHAALALLLGDESALAEDAPRLASALEGDIRYSPLARLVAAAVRYLPLVREGSIDASVSNPKLFPPARIAARAALSRAIGELGGTTARTPSDEDLLNELVDLTDGTIAAAVTLARSPVASARCEAEPRVPEGPLRDTFQRLRKRQRRVLAMPGMLEGDGAFAKRARLVALVVSDALDVLDRRASDTKPTIPAARARELVLEGGQAWLETEVAKAVAEGYLAARLFLAGDAADTEALRTQALRAFSAAVAALGDHGESSVFSWLGDKVLVANLAAAPTPAEALATLAAQAFDDGAEDVGNTLLLLAHGASVVAESGVPTEALAIARKHKSAVILPLELRSDEALAGRGEARMRAAFELASEGACDAPDPSSVLAVRGALEQFRAGERAQALQKLETTLERAERQGLLVPRQHFRYRERRGSFLFTADESLSSGSPLLAGASSFNLGLGIEESGDLRPSALEISFEPRGTSSARNDATRFYAHTALLASVLYRLAGDDVRAGLAARRALAAHGGVGMLGDEPIAASSDASWLRDSTATLALAAQQAAEAHEPFLAGDLFALERRALGELADDHAVLGATKPLPKWLSELGALEPLAARARRSLETLFAPLRCTDKPGEADTLARPACRSYALALGLRVADGLTVLPRLGPKAPDDAPVCEAFRALDAFLAAAAERRYEPAEFTRAVRELMDHGHPADAATLLATQRHPQHCSEDLVRFARTLGRNADLGKPLQVDALSVALVCAPPDTSELDIALFDELATSLGSTLRRFEVLTFATRVAQAGHPGPLLALTKKDRFVDTWRARSPDLGALVLLVHDAASVIAGEPIDQQATLAPYRLLCTSFPSKERAPICATIARLRDSSAPARPGSARATADQAIAQFIEIGAALLAEEAKRAAPPTDP